MKHISLLIPQGEISLSNIEAVHKMFTKVNEALRKEGIKPKFEVGLIGTHRSVKVSNGPFNITTDQTLEEVKKTDIIIIPAIHGNMEINIRQNAAFIPWITQRHQEGAEIASLCIGAFILAATGLLNGKTCTTHWLAADEFRSMFPEVRLNPYKILTDENGIYTSGGAYSSLNLILYLVEKYAGREMAVLASKIFEIDIDRDSQSPFIIFNGQKEHDDPSVKEAQILIETRFQDQLSVKQLANSVAIGRRSLERRFKKATGNTIMEYIQRVKIEAAKKQLELGHKNVSEVMYEVGYSDTKAFRNTFKKITGLSPVVYRKRHSRLIQEMTEFIIWLK